MCVYACDYVYGEHTFMCTLSFMLVCHCTTPMHCISLCVRVLSPHLCSVWGAVCVCVFVCVWVCVCFTYFLLFSSQSCIPMSPMKLKQHIFHDNLTHTHTYTHTHTHTHTH